MLSNYILHYTAYATTQCNGDIMSTYNLKFDASKQIIMWTEYFPWGYAEAKHRSGIITEMTKSSAKPWAFIVNNEHQGQFKEPEEAIETFQMVFDRFTQLPNFSGIFGTVTSRHRFAWMATSLIPMFYRVRWYTHRNPHILYRNVHSALMTRYPPAQLAELLPNDSGFGPKVW